MGLTILGAGPGLLNGGRKDYEREVSYVWGPSSRVHAIRALFWSILIQNRININKFDQNWGGGAWISTQRAAERSIMFPLNYVKQNMH